MTVEWISENIGLDEDGFIVLPSGNRISPPDLVDLFDGVPLTYGDLTKHDVDNDMGYTPLFDQWRAQGLIK